MSSELPTPSGCCSECNTPTTTNIPGPQGVAGHNAFSATTAGFSVPAGGSTVVINLADSAFAAVGQSLYIAGAGYYQVTALGSGGNITAKNLGVPGNAAPGTAIAAPSVVTPAGAQGSAGTLNSLSPTTTKGDLMVDSGAGSGSASVVRLAAGANKNVLHADSTQTNGLQYRAIDLTGGNTALSGALPISLGGSGATTQQAAINSLMPNLPVLGDLCYYNGTNWVRFPITVTTGIKQLLRINAAGNSIEYAYQGIVQRLVNSLSSYHSTTNAVALGNTAPTTSSGSSPMSQAITPVSATTKIKVRASASILTTASGGFIAIFNGSTCVAVAATTAASQLVTLTCEYQAAPGSVSPITFNFYYGGISSGTTYINGNASAGLWNGSAIAMLTVEEYA